MFDAMVRSLRRHPRLIAFDLGLALLGGLAIFSPTVANVFNLATGQGYFIPAQSSVFSFTVIEMNHGSGEWWLLGEDSRRYYANAAAIEEPSYLMIGKDAASRCRGFVVHDPATWFACPEVKFVGDVEPLSFSDWPTLKPPPR